MAVYQVGQPYNPRIPQFPEGLHILGLSAERQEIAVALAGLTADEIEGFRSGPFDVALASAQELGVLLVSFAGSNGWMDVEWDIRRAPEGERTPLPGGYTLVNWFLIDASTGIIRAMRQATVSPALTERLSMMAARQLALPFSAKRHAQLVAEYQSRPSEVLARKAWVSERLGISEPPTAPATSTRQEVAARYPELDSRVHEVMAEALAHSGARIEHRAGVDWWIDPEFGPDVPVLKLGYDETLGMVDRRAFPEPGQA